MVSGHHVCQASTPGVYDWVGPEALVAMGLVSVIQDVGQAVMFTLVSDGVTGVIQ